MENRFGSPSKALALASQAGDPTGDQDGDER